MRAARRSDRGSVLLISIILVVVILGMAGAYLVLATDQARRVADEAERSRARVAAESGVDLARVRLLALVDPEAADPAAGWDSVLASDRGIPAWGASVATLEGSYSVRVLDNNDGDGDPRADSDETVVIESTGFGSKEGAAGPSHVIRCVVSLVLNDPTGDFAILTGGDLEIWGNEVTDGTLGSVHTNDDLLLEGNADISQSATASATATQVGSTVSVGGQFLADQPLILIPTVDPTVYRPHANWILTWDGRVLDGATGVQLYSFPRTAGPTTPTYNGFTWSRSAGWSTATSGWVDGMYYIEGSIRFNQGGTATQPWKVTLVAQGNIQMEGNPYLQPYYNHTELLVAGKDISARGTGTTNALIEGLVLAHEQIQFDGNITYSGRVVAESAVNTPDSLNAHALNPLLSIFGGCVHVTYDGGLTRSIVSDYRLPIRSWQEELLANAGR